jgi:O-acetylserine/cysteine efflux transporter
VVDSVKISLSTISKRIPMPITDFFLALLVVTIWGINFLFMKMGVSEVPPLLLCVMRFILASVPAIFFIKRPAIPFKWVALYGFVMFDMQFGLGFLGMKAGMTAGMASLIMQVQVFLSMFMAAVILGETPFIWQVVGAAISFCGIGVVAMHLDQNLTLVGFLCIIAASASWGYANLFTKKFGKINMMALVVWSSFFAIFPMTLLSMIYEGPFAIVSVYQHISWLGVLSVFYLTYPAIWVGYGIWNWLLGRHPVGTVVPFTLLIPVIGMAGSVFVLHEPFQNWKVLAAILVICGLMVNLFGGRIYQLFRMRESVTQE